MSSSTLGPLTTALFASVAVDPSSTNSLAINGPISQAAGVFGAIANPMVNGQTLTINGNVSITNATSTVAQSFTLTGASLSTTIMNGVVSDGGLGSSSLTLGYTNPTKTTVYPAITPTIEINGTNTYTGITTLNMATVLVGNNQAFGVETAGNAPNSQGELRFGSSANEFGYNLESANDSIAINNGVDLGQFLTIEGATQLPSTTISIRRFRARSSISFPPAKRSP